MIKTVTIQDLIQNAPHSYALLDVRSPSEYLEGHIPKALSMPLFSDHEREVVGTAYKSAGPDAAMKLGLEFVGPKMSELVAQATKFSDGKPIVMHCWRGGKRSGSVAWLLDFAGLPVSVLDGGYKAYRTYQRTWLAEAPLNLIVLGGKTGSGKTEILKSLAERGEQVLDLEALAHHKGSAFGWIGEQAQPTTEQFENDIFEALWPMDPHHHIWIENESLTIGKVFVPQSLYDKMQQAPLMHIDVPIHVRVAKLVANYADGQVNEALKASFQKIATRLGGQHLKAAIEALEQGDYHKSAEIALVYYDKAYYYGLEQSKSSYIRKIEVEEFDTSAITDQLLTEANQIQPPVLI